MRRIGLLVRLRPVAYMQRRHYQQLHVEHLGKDGIAGHDFADGYLDKHCYHGCEDVIDNCGYYSDS